MGGPPQVSQRSFLRRRRPGPAQRPTKEHRQDQQQQEPSPLDGQQPSTSTSTSDSHSSSTSSSTSSHSSHGGGHIAAANSLDREGPVANSGAAVATPATGPAVEGNIHLPDDPATGGGPNNDDNDSSFRPVVTARYPPTDHSDHPLNPLLPQFCFPAGTTVVPSTTYEFPRVHHCVLTDGKGRKVYGTCLTFFDEYIPPPHSPWFQPPLAEPLGGGDNDDSSTVDGVELQVVDNGLDNNDGTVPRRRRRVLYLPKVLCLLSTWPYLTAFREYLSQLYRLATLTNTMEAPIERYVVNLYEIPAPPPGAYEIQVTILNSTIRFWAPPAKLPIAYTALPFQILFECLDVDQVVQLWASLLLERKVLLVSSQYSILAVCAEIATSLLFPLRWCHLYIPLLPRALCPVLDAPGTFVVWTSCIIGGGGTTHAHSMEQQTVSWTHIIFVGCCGLTCFYDTVPYLCGIVRENWLHAQAFLSGETVVVDLDRNTVVVGDAVPPSPPFPSKKFHKLQACLSETVGHVYWRARGLEKEYRIAMTKKPGKRQLDVLKQRQSSRIVWQEKLAGLDHAFNLAYTPDSPNLLSDTLPDDERAQWDRVQSGYLRFFTALFKEYRKYLARAGTKQASFDRIGFLAAQKAEQAEFLVELCMSQGFDDFISRRMFSPGEPDLVFFDQSIDAKLNRSKLKLHKKPTPFLQSAKVHKELKKIHAVDVNTDGLPPGGGHYVYKAWPDEFDPGLFSPPRPVPEMIAAEFDRQGALVAKLRASGLDEAGDDDVLECVGGDYDESPHVASFTVFFFMYSALVGKDWQEYQRRRSEAIKAQTRAAAREMRDDCDEIEAVLSPTIDILPEEHEAAVHGCMDDLSMGLCDACPEDSVLALKSAIVYCGDGAHDMYSKLFENTAKQVAEFQLQLNAATLTQNEQVIDAEDALIEYEEAKEVAVAQLDLAFEVLRTMSLRGLSTDSDAYLSLMEACGRCGDTQRALHLIELMRSDGFVADGEVLGCFVSAFAHEEVQDDASIEVEAVMDDGSGGSKSDAYSKYLKKKLASASSARPASFNLSSLQEWSQQGPCGLEDSTTTADALSDASVSSTEWAEKPPTGGAAFLDWISHHQDGACSNRRKAHRRRRRRSSVTDSGTANTSTSWPVTELVARQLELSDTLLDFLYPNLEFDSADTCPHCSHELSEADVVNGWAPCAFQDYTSACPRCGHRFVPRFSVSSSSPTFEGSQGPGTPLYCEYLSPWVVRRELHRLIKGDGGVGVQGLLRPSWRNGTGIEAALFWNLVLLCRRYRLPASFLLQGSFERSRLVLPRMPADMG